MTKHHNPDDETVRSALLVKQARLSRILELFQGEQISTFCIAERLKMSEADACALLDEVDRRR
jgi:hypothetical protein